MKNYICEGERMQVILTDTVSSGDILVVGSKICVALNSGVADDVIVVMNEGVFSIPKAVGAITQGQKLYFDGSAKNITGTAYGNTFAGYAYLPALSADATVQILIVDNPASPVPVEAGAVAVLTGTVTGTANGVLVDVAATAGACAGTTTPTATQVDTAIATAVASIVTGTNEQNKELMTTLNAVIVALKAAGLMAS